MTRQTMRSLRGDATRQTPAFFTPFNDSIQPQRPDGVLTVGADVTSAQAESVSVR